MLLTVRDAAKLLGIPEKKIYRWIDDGEIPFHQVNDQLRFHRAELLEWATARRLPISVEMFHDEDMNGKALPSFAEALKAGGVYYGVEGANRHAVLSAVVEHMPVPKDLDREFLLEVLEAREALGSTGVGDGIAIPHVRNPVVLNAAAPSITLCFLDKPVEFHSIDGRPVHTIFSLLSPTIKVHLQLLAKLSWALHDLGFREAVLQRAKADEIFSEAQRVEASFPHAAHPVGTGA
jgi:PTS system nitrogen regulatory IIA component